MADKRIVVGVDGSDSSIQALRWAARLGGLTDADVEAVIAWEFPPFYGAVGWAPPIEDLYPPDLARRVLDEALEKAFGEERPARLQTRIEQGSAAGVLIAAAADAALLVVGNRGHSSFAEAVLGSVSLASVHHASCPVMVIHGEIML